MLQTPRPKTPTINEIFLLRVSLFDLKPDLDLPTADAQANRAFCLRLCKASRNDPLQLTIQPL